MQVRRGLHAHAVAAHVAYQLDDLAVGDVHARGDVGIHLHGVQVGACLGSTCRRESARRVRLKGPVTANETEHPRPRLHHGGNPAGHATQAGALPHVACQRNLAAVQRNHRLARTWWQRHTRVGPTARLERSQVDPKRSHLGRRQIIRSKVEVLAHATGISQAGKDLPSGTCVVMQHGQHSVAVKHARIVATHDRTDTAVGLQIGHVGQHIVGRTCRLGPADIDRHEQVKLPQDAKPRIGVTVTRTGVAGIDDEPAQVASEDGLADGRAQTAHRIDERIALGAQLGFRRHRRRRKARRVQVAQREGRRRVERTARTPQAAQQHIDQADSARRLGAVGIRNADATVKARIDHGGRRRGSQIARRRADVVGRHITHRLGPLGCPGTSRLRQLIKARGIAGHKVTVVQVLDYQNVGNTQQQGQVAARAHAQPAVGKRGRTAAPRIHHNDLRPAATGIVECVDRTHRR